MIWQDVIALDADGNLNMRDNGSKRKKFSGNKKELIKV